MDSYTAKERGTEGPDIGFGVGMAVLIAGLQALTSVCVTHFIYGSMITGGQARAALIALIFVKSLKISGRAKAGDVDIAAAGDGEGVGWSNGRVVNLMGTDTYRVDQACGFFHILWSSPVQIIFSLILLLVNISYSALSGFALLMLGIPLLSWVVKVLARKRMKMNLITDKRVALTQEILMGVRFVKFFGWEESFLKRLQELRRAEIGAIQFLLGVRSGVNAVGMVSFIKFIGGVMLTVCIVASVVCLDAGVHHILAHRQ